jgi:hypothetical protein
MISPRKRVFSNIEVAAVASEIEGAIVAAAGVVNCCVPAVMPAARPITRSYLKQEIAGCRRLVIPSLG